MRHGQIKWYFEVARWDYNLKILVILTSLNSVDRLVKITKVVIFNSK